RFAVGAGYPNDFQTRRGRGIKTGCESSQCLPSMRDYPPGNIFASPFSRRIADHSFGTVLDGCVDVAVAVRRVAAHGNKKPSRTNTTRVVVQPLDFRIASPVLDPEPL